jgi:hypothetical protein
MRHLGFAWLAGIAIVVACDSNVETVDGSGGAGTTSASSTSVTKSASSSVASTSAPSSTTGGGNTCEQACQHAATCGFDVCAQFMLDCNNPLAECPAACILDASCGDLLAIAMGSIPPVLGACLFECQQGTGGGGTGGGGQGCGQCAFGADCFDPCFNSQNCMAWGQCALGCGDPGCYADCNAMHPEAVAEYTQIYACMCTSCQAECATEVDPCNQGGTGGAGGS